MLRSVDLRQFARFVVNGLAATAVHFGTLTFLVEVVNVGSKGVANSIAAVLGIFASFLGNRFFVFASKTGSLRRELLRFSALYATLALLSGALMALWADVLAFDYRIGFVVISGIQLVLSFLGNRMLVFKV
ncbi:TPA: GtrA family protein [Stenotrophomonas maltophilia]|uniref:GtrA family protein n=1 Tax=Stenotrophomonas TaxID=40323 RepID=UPI0013130141|nr:GtrA family protein [Stenotrophomonas sp.]MBA0420789.1 GtrA family protein [Stenotrophomonas maltophilia]MBD3741259.1 GtrA family protein [Stenotrophomonas sp.]HDS1835101.1 GtrA family protein [Stenotrophomonas maltophilia]HEL5027060.1 GtrA family protein [Stenotrophomonas maltophilia]